MNLIRAFLPKIRTLFFKFWRRAGEISPHRPLVTRLYGDVKIKQYSKVTYLDCELEESLSREAMALKVINKINSRLTLLYRKNRYLAPYLKRLLSHALIRPHSDYACSAWCPNLNKKFKSKLQTAQNRCIT